MTAKRAWFCKSSAAGFHAAASKAGSVYLHKDLHPFGRTASVLSSNRTPQPELKHLAWFVNAASW